ncbi:unnamed protein product [Gongylonema pulchrum]|uniref:Transposase n=1 Tax=Gongylonema pulchrum TaxID=637853 RepID=A0A183DRQ6_9BILA|nr:unnamed protein product [Gongylonema pulchrum]
MFVDEKQTVGIDLTEKLLLKLAGMTKENKAHDFNRTTVVCKVEVCFSEFCGVSN